MDSRRRLTEATFFLDQLKQHESSAEVFEFYMTAFLSSWRSIMDIMLYDVAEHFLGVTRDQKFNDEELKVLAEEKGSKRAIEFIDWWSAKQKILFQHPLWEKRNISFHRGYPSMNVDFIYLGGSGGTSGTISFSLRQYAPDPTGPGPLRSVPQPDFSSKRFSFTEIPDRDAIDVCQEALFQMKKIHEEAEKVAGIGL